MKEMQQMSEMAELIRQSRALYGNLNKMRNAMYAEIQRYTDTNRIAPVGEKVVVYDDMGRRYGEGILGDARTCVFLEDDDIIKYNTEWHWFPFDLSRLRYSVYAVKADGTRSAKFAPPGRKILLHGRQDGEPYFLLENETI